MRTIVSGFISPQVSWNTTLPLRAMRPDAPARRPASTWPRITVLIRFRRSPESPFCSGAAVGNAPAKTSERVKVKTIRIRMTGDSSTVLGHPLLVASQWCGIRSGGGFVVLAVGRHGFEVFGFKHLVTIQTTDVIHPIAPRHNLGTSMPPANPKLTHSIS